MHNRGRSQRRDSRRRSRRERHASPALLPLNLTLALLLQAATCVFVSSNIVHDIVSTGPNRVVSLPMYRAFSPPSWRPFRKAP